jgi:site-specific DNA-methyltransferase (adenine-specific)/modification methylase
MIAPVFERDGITLYRGDCREILPTLPRDAAIVTDPPYGIDLGKRNGGSRSKCATAMDRYEIAGDDRPFDPTPWTEFPWAILWGGNHYASRLPDARCWLAWDKREGGTSDDQADCELAWTNLAGPERLFSHRWRGMIKASERNQKRIHPAQKPVALMSWCLSFLPPDVMVIDPYAGSGTTGVACLKSGRRCILIESDPRYIPIINRRCRDAEMPLLAGGAL